MSFDKKPGGISNMIESSTEALALHCDYVNIFLLDSFLKNKSFSKRFFSIKNININKINFFDRKLFKLGLLTSKIKKKIIKADIIFVHNSNLLKVLRFNFPSKKIILFFHTDKLKQLNEFRYADKVLTVNKTMKKKVNSLYSNKATYLPNTLYESRKYEISKKQISNLNKKPTFVVGAMGRLVKKKGFDFLIKACVEIKNLELLIAGDGDEFANLKKISDKYNNIKLLGWVNNKNKFFNSIDVFCSSSIMEPFGLVIIEAMSRGIPVISTKCNGPLDIIENNKNGLLIEIENKLELKDAIIKLKNNDSIRKKMGLNAINTYKKMFTFNKYKKNVNSILKQL